MRRKLIFLFFLISIFPAISSADIGPHCNNKISQDVLKNFDNLKIGKIEIKAHKYRICMVYFKMI